MGLGDEFDAVKPEVSGVEEGEYIEGFDLQYERSEELRDIETLYRDWEEARHIYTEHTDLGVEEEYEKVVDAVEEHDIDTSPETLYTFARGMLLEDYDGLLLSAMINKSSADETFYLPGMDEVSYVGYRNCKQVVVEGDLRWAAGRLMQGGRLELRGNAGQNPGWEMQDGTVIVEDGDEKNIGLEMGGGRIEVHGDAAAYVGKDMRGGEIEVRGDANFGAGSDMKGGELVIQESAWKHMAYGMSGGTIRVGAMDVVEDDRYDHEVGGSSMSGGTVYIGNDTFSADPGRWGGTVEHREDPFDAEGDTDGA
jgi:glutamate synthase domain-containing protein 3